MDEQKVCNKCKSEKVYRTETTEMGSRGGWSYMYWCQECWGQEYKARCEKKSQEMSRIDDTTRNSRLMQAKDTLESNGYSVTKNNMNEHYETAKWPIIVWMLIGSGIFIFLAGAVTIMYHLDTISTCSQLAIK